MDKSTPRSMAEVRAECAALGVTPGRSVAECERRIADHKMQVQCAEHEAKRAARMAVVTTPGAETHSKFAEAFAKAACVVLDPLNSIMGADEVAEVSPDVWSRAAAYTAPAVQVMAQQARAAVPVNGVIITPDGKVHHPLPRYSAYARGLLSGTALRGPVLANAPGLYRGA